MSGFCVTLMALPSRLNALKDFNGTISLLKASKSLQRPQKPYQLSFLRPATHSRHTPFTYSGMPVGLPGDRCPDHLTGQQLGPVTTKGNLARTIL